MPKSIKKTIRAYADPHPELPLDPDVVQPGVYKWPPHFQPMLVVYVFVGGCVGTALRYTIVQLVPDNYWPYATMTVNFVGAFALGFLLEALARGGEDRGLRRMIRLLVGTGMIGAFTTYSTFAVDTRVFIAAGELRSALLYIVTMLVGGVVLCGIGVQLATMRHLRKEKA